MKMKQFLAGVLAGLLLAVAAFGVRTTIVEFQALKVRVSYIEGYLGMLDKLLRGAVEPGPAASGFQFSGKKRA